MVVVSTVQVNWPSSGKPRSPHRYLEHTGQSGSMQGSRWIRTLAFPLK